MMCIHCLLAYICYYRLLYSAAVFAILLHFDRALAQIAIFELYQIEQYLIFLTLLTLFIQAQMLARLAAILPVLPKPPCLAWYEVSLFDSVLGRLYIIGFGISLLPIFDDPVIKCSLIRPDIVSCCRRLFQHHKIISHFAQSTALERNNTSALFQVETGSLIHFLFGLFKYIVL